jgi:hypothetical protein
MRRAMVIGMVVAAVAWAAPGHAQSGGDRLPSAPFGYAVFGLGNVTLPSLQEGEGMRKERLRTGRSVSFRRNGRLSRTTRPHGRNQSGAAAARKDLRNVRRSWGERLYPRGCEAQMVAA